LADGSVVVGVVLDEGETGYLVRSVDGETVRVPYDQVLTVTVLGAGSTDSSSQDPAPEPEEPRSERSDSAGVRYHLSEGAAVGAGVLFGTGMGTTGAGAAVAIETNEELPGTPIVIGGLVQVAVSTILLGTSTNQARSAANLYGLDTRGAHGVVVAGIILKSLGLAMGVVAIPVTIEGDDEEAIGVASGALALGITGHIMAQAGIGRMRSVVARERDREQYGTGLDSHRRPRVTLAGVWCSRTRESTVLGASFLF